MAAESACPLSVVLRLALGDRPVLRSRHIPDRKIGREGEMYGIFRMNEGKGLHEDGMWMQGHVAFTGV